jgi:hypothetical protein
MSDLLHPPAGHVNSVAPGSGEPPISPPESLRCQWCSVPLAAGVTVCPTCGSAGIPDPRMTVPDVADLETHQPDPLRTALTSDNGPAGEADLVEWWRDETSGGANGEASVRVVDFEEVERRRMQSIVFMGGAVVVCAMLGWLIGPSLLVGPFEGLTGTEVEDLADLRGMGTIGGLVIGMFIGATGGWVIWSDK